MAKFGCVKRPFPSVAGARHEFRGQGVQDWVFRRLMEVLPCSLTIWKKHNESFWLSLIAGISMEMLVREATDDGL